MDIAINKIGADSAVTTEVASINAVSPGLPLHQKPAQDNSVSGKIDASTAKKITEQIQDYLDTTNVNVSFSSYGGDGRNISITVTEKKTGKVIREIPAKELQRLQTKMEELIGMIFNESV